MRNNKRLVRNRLKRFRRIAGMKQLEIARKLGMKCTERISRWEKGTASPNLENLLKLSLLYQAPPHELYPDYMEELKDDMDLQEE
jgi:transcriptional regulator with XRE-family HTH domain